MRNSRKALIVGAGIGGLTTAIALKKIGYEPLVFERALQHKENGTTLVLWPNALRVLQKLELADEVIHSGVRNHKTSVFTSKGRLLYELPLIHIESKYGFPVTTVLRSDLHRLLLQRLGSEHIMWGKEFTHMEQDDYKVNAHFADGHAEEGQFMVGADGIHSMVRKMIAEEVRLHYCGYAAYRGRVDYHPSMFLPHCSMEVWGRGKRFGLFPSGRNSLYWFATMNCEENEHLSQQGRKSDLLNEFANWGDLVEQILEQSEDSAILRHPIYDIPSLPYWTKGRIALLGDAAHAMTPNLGQGACQAIEDSYILCESIEHANNNIAAALKRYEWVRMPRVRKISALSYRMGRITQWSNPFLCRLRNETFSVIPNYIKLKQLEWIMN